MRSLMVCRAGWLSADPDGPKGSRNKLAQEFIDACYDSWHAAAALDRMATESPSRYCQMMAALIPQHFKVEHERALLLSDDDLRRLGCWKYGRNWLSSMLTRRYLVRPSRARARDLLAGVAGGPRGDRDLCPL